MAVSHATRLGIDFRNEAKGLGARLVIMNYKHVIFPDSFALQPQALCVDSRGDGFTGSPKSKQAFAVSSGLFFMVHCSISVFILSRLSAAVGALHQSTLPK